MGLGILEPKSGGDHVQGTTRYYDDSSQTQFATDETTGLKCDKSGPVPIILIPQPSDDPNDPLNWPLWRRDLATFFMCFAAILATSLGPILAANTITIARLFQQNLTTVPLLTGYYLMGAGAAAILFIPSGRVWGKRHLFIIGICIIIGSSAWAGAVEKNYRSLIGARVVQGVGTAPFESMINAAVGDLYYVHQRGTRMAFANLAVFGGAFFTPILVGKITATMGFGWTFYWVAILMAVAMPAVFFLCPETAYRREDRLNTDIVVDEPKPLGTNRDGQERRQKGLVLFPTSSALQPIGNSDTPKKTWIETLSLFDGRKTNESYWVLLLRPFPLILNPAFVWGCLIQGTIIGWTVFIGVMIGALFIGPPYFWGEVKAGYAYTGAFIGAIGGFVVSGLLADTSVRWMTRMNKGVYEPEFRILLVVPMFILGAIGLFGFGITVDDVITNKYSYVVPLVFFGFEVAAMVVGAVASSLYIVDAYRDLAIEGLTLMIIFKNFFSFALTWYAYDWLIYGGIQHVLVSISGVQVAVCALSIPMYIYGKRCRAFYHKHDLLAITGLRRERTSQPSKGLRSWLRRGQD